MSKDTHTEKKKKELSKSKAKKRRKKRERREKRKGRKKKLHCSFIFFPYIEKIKRPKTYQSNIYTYKRITYK